MDVPEPPGVEVFEAILAAAEAKMLNRDPSRSADVSTPTRAACETHLSQKGTASSRSLPTPDMVFFCTTAMGRLM